MNLTKLLLIGLTVGILAVAITVLFRPQVRDDDTIRQIRQVLILPRVALGAKLISRIDTSSHLKNFADNAYPGWNQDTAQFKSLVLFAIKLLDFWATYGRKKSQNYPKIVESVVSQIVGKLKQADLSKVPWGDSWYTFSALVTRMLVMYEYIGDKPDLQQACHDQLVRIIPSVGTTHMPSDSEDYNIMNIYFTAVPRLCSNYMFNPEDYKVDIQSPEFARIQKFLNFEKVMVDEPRTGVYRDYSWIHYTCVATYQILFGLYNFHERAYAALGHKSAIRELAAVIIPKILHPQIPYRPFGLSGRNGDIYDNTRYWNLVPNSFGVQIMPFIGFGVFKTPETLFYVRVQRPGIAAFVTNSFKTEKIFALAWIQLPKIYIRTYKSFENYDAVITGESLMKQPGLLLIENDKLESNSLSLSNENLKPCHVDPESIDSFIGTIKTKKDGDILFWKNKYKFSQYYGECTITEIGLVCESMARFLLIVNNQSDNDLTFRYREKDHYLYEKTSLINSEELSDVTVNDIIRIPKTKRKEINWIVLFQTAWPGEIKCSGNEVTFKTDDIFFHVQTIESNNTFVVRFKDNTKIVAGGSSSSDPDHTFNEGNVTLVRDKDTLMYYPNETH